MRRVFVSQIYLWIAKLTRYVLVTVFTYSFGANGSCETQIISWILCQQWPLILLSLSVPLWLSPNTSSHQPLCEPHSPDGIKPWSHNSYGHPREGQYHTARHWALSPSHSQLTMATDRINHNGFYSSMSVHQTPNEKRPTTVYTHTSISITNHMRCQTEHIDYWNQVYVLLESNHMYFQS